MGVGVHDRGCKCLACIFCSRTEVLQFKYPVGVSANMCFVCCCLISDSITSKKRTGMRDDRFIVFALAVSAMMMGRGAGVGVGVGIGVSHLQGWRFGSGLVRFWYGMK